MKKFENKKIGIKEIARLAGVSIGTVDRVIHNRGHVAPETRTLINNIINELNYKPNFIGRSLASKTKTITVLIPDSSGNAYWELPMHGLYNAISEIEPFNFHVDITTYDYSNENSFKNGLQKIIQLNPDGVILAPLFENESIKATKLFEKANIPYVLIDIMLENSKPLAYYGENSLQSGMVAARLMHMLTKNNKKNKILIIKPLVFQAHTIHFDLREKGFLNYFQSQNLSNYEFSSHVLDVSSKLNIESYLYKIINSGHFDGIFVPNSRAYVIAEYLYQTNSIKIPLIGYDLITQNRNWMEKDIIQFLICQKPEEQGYKSIMCLFNFLAFNKKNEVLNFCPIDIVCKENLYFYK